MSIPVYYLITDLDWGGAEKNLVALATHLPAPFEPHVGCLFNAGQAAEPLRAAGISVDCFEITGLRDLRRILSIVRRLRAGKFRLLHTSLFHANMIGRVAGGLAGTPHIVSSVRVAERRRWHLWLDGLSQWLIDREICVGQRLCHYTARFGRVSPRKLISIPNAIAGLPVPPQRDGRTTCNILGVGRFDPQKRWRDLVDSLAQIVALDWRARIVGVGNRDPLARYVRDSGLDGRIELRGPQYPLDDQYRWADLFALSSIWEGMPNVILEAMAWELPVVATDVGAMDELVLDQLTGFRVPPRNPTVLANRLAELIQAASMRRQMGQTGRQRVADSFSVERLVAKTTALYRQLIAGTGPVDQNASELAACQSAANRSGTA